MIFDWYTSDPHYFHNNVIRYCDRPHKDMIHMNEDMIAKWNSVVKPDDTICCLGDFSLAARAVEVITPRLNGIKYLIPGNHDFCHPYHKKSRKTDNAAKWLEFYTRHGWNVLPIFYEMEIPGIANVNMCHIPYDNNDPRYDKFRPKDDGRWLIHGHVHERWKINKKQINVGVDVFGFTPVHIEEIKKIISENP